MSENIKYAEERQQKILDLLREKKRINVKELALILSVTDATIRRDLKVLEDKNRLYRTHGGAILKEKEINWQMTSLDSRERIHVTEKQLIAHYAITLIHDGDSLMIDGGSTNVEIAKLLSIKKKNLQVITNCPKIGYILSKGNSSNKVITTGGELLYQSQNTVGYVAEENLRRYKVNLAFIGASSLSSVDGCFSADIQESSIKMLMIKQANNVYIVSDSSKFKSYAFSRFTDFSDITGIITDKNVSVTDQTIFHDRGIKLFML